MTAFDWDYVLKTVLPINMGPVTGIKPIMIEDNPGYSINSVIDSFLDCGITTFNPFEPMAGMDMVKTKKKYGRIFSIKGGIDKTALLRGREEIRRELEYKICNETLRGGTVFGLDHRIPNNVK